MCFVFHIYTVYRLAILGQTSLLRWETKRAIICFFYPGPVVVEAIAVAVAAGGGEVV